jgi:MOSC domain-containing protein YiiM
MHRVVIITSKSVSQKAELNNSPTADIVHNALPLSSVVRRWGDEVYFEIPVSVILQDPRELVQKGDIAYWNEGRCLCIFFGQTPISKKGEIRPASAVDIIGRLLGDPKEFSSVSDGNPITVTREDAEDTEAHPKVIAVCRSEKKGTRKQNIDSGKVIRGFGLEGDAHADCNTHRQVSLLAKEGIDKMRRRGYDVGPGDFAENITTEGIDLLALPEGARIKIGDAVLEVTQKGKECHIGCEVYKRLGICVAREEAIFAKVMRGGTISTGDTIQVL